MKYAYMSLERFGRDHDGLPFAARLRDVYWSLRETALSEHGLLLEAPDEDPPNWCKFHDMNGEERNQGEYGAAQKKYRASLCRVPKLTNSDQLDKWLLTGEAPSGT